MNNVIRLFARENAEIARFAPEAHSSTAVAEILASSARLGDISKALLKHFDAIEKAIETIDDTETRNRLKQSTKLKREALSNAMGELSQQIGKFVNFGGA